MQIGVAVIVKNQDGEILIGKRKGGAGAGMWAFPGGKPEMHETFEQTCAREVKEETNLDIHQFPRLINYTDNMMEDGAIWRTFFYCAHVKFQSDELKNLEPEKCENWIWVTRDDLINKFKLWEVTPRMMREIWLFNESHSSRD